MAVATYIPAKLVKSQVDGSGVIDFDTDTLKCALVVAGAGIPSTSKTGVQFVSDVTGANAEVTGTGYARQTLAGVTVAFGSGDDVDFSFTAITFGTNAAGFTTGRYGVLFKDAGGADSANRVFAILDLNATVSAVAGDVVLSAPAGGLIQWTKSP
jgi:hypothetical protein